jgi:hypothetical protein
MTTEQPAEPPVRKAHAVLERVSRETLDPPERPPERREGQVAVTDKIEQWGRRIGRTLGLIFAILLIINLVKHWVF